MGKAKRRAQAEEGAEEVEPAQAEADAAAEEEAKKAAKKAARRERKQQAAEEAAEEDPPAKGKKKSRRGFEEDLAEGSGELADPGDDDRPSKKEKEKRRKQAAALEEDAAGELADPGDDDRPSRKEKKKRRQEAAALAEEAEGEPVAPGDADGPSKKDGKKKRKQAAAPEEADGEPAEPNGADGPSKKEKKKRKQAAELEEAGAEEPEKPAAAKNGKSGSPKAGVALEPLTVFVGGIPYSCTEAILRRDFEECGKVTEVNLLTDRATGRFRGIALVKFAEEAGVEAALGFDGDDYGGRPLKVCRAEASAVHESRISSGGFEVFVRGLPADTTEESLRTRFAACGTIGRVNLPTRGTGKCKGFAWLTFGSKADMEKAIELNGTGTGGTKLVVEAAGEHKSGGGGGGKGKGKGKVSTEREVFLSNLSYEAQEAELRKDFSECGEIERMHMPMRESKSMGFAWITFTTQEAVDRALSYNGEDYGGRRLKIEKSGQHKVAAVG